MSSNVALLPATKSESAIGGSSSFPFTKSEINKRVAEIDAAGQKGIIFRDTETRGLVLRKQHRDWIFAIYRKIHGKVYRVTVGPYSVRTDLNATRAMA